jgi:hypothetical protein
MSNGCCTVGNSYTNGKIGSRAMMNDQIEEQVLKFIERQGTCELGHVRNEYPIYGVKAVRSLMERGRVSFTIDWELQVEP